MKKNIELNENMIIDGLNDGFVINPLQSESQDRDDIFFFGEFCYENLMAFVQDFKDTGDKVNIHITSVGGSVAVLTSMLHMINTSKKDIVIVVSGLVASCGFDFILKTNRKIVFTEIACGLVHDMDITCSLKELKKNSKSFDKFIADEVEASNEKYYTMLAEKGFTEDEIAVVTKGEDLLLGRDRLLELFADRIYEEVDCESEEDYITEYEDALSEHIVEKILEKIEVKKTKVK